MNALWFPALPDRQGSAKVSRALRAVSELLGASVVADGVRPEELNGAHALIDSEEEISSHWMDRLTLSGLIESRCRATVLRLGESPRHEWLLRGGGRPRRVSEVSAVLTAIVEAMVTKDGAGSGEAMSAPEEETSSGGEPVPSWLRRVDLLLNSPGVFEAGLLHDHGKAAHQAEQVKKGLERLTRTQALAWRRVRAAHGRMAPLNVLIVDNTDWPGVYAYAKEQWQELVRDDHFRFCFHHYESPALDRWRCLPLTSPGPGAEVVSGSHKRIRWDRLDLILQDVHLGSGEPLGYELAERYFERAPQAMVFLLTSMSLEALASSSVAGKVDRILSKRFIRGLGWEYYQRFRELFGELLWRVWTQTATADKPPAQVKAGQHLQPPSLTSSKQLRHLFGSLRKWSFEPEILFHGYALPEMVDHAYRHTRAVWDLAQGVLAPFLEQRPEALSPEETVLLCLGIWMHDVGHVGDEHFVDSSDIRPMHGSISDRHLVRNPRALGLEWLLGDCVGECRRPRRASRDRACEARLKNINLREGCAGGHICSLRRVGLLARYHQQSAPMFPENLTTIVEKAKPITPYCRVKLSNETGKNDKWQESADSQADVSRWLNGRVSLEWDAHTVRLLRDFRQERGIEPNLIRIEFLLRWLDGLQLHGCRVGSPVRAETLRNYLQVRCKHVERLIEEAEHDLHEHGSYDERGIASRARLETLHYYHQLLQAQDIHHWLHSSVTSVRVEGDRGAAPKLVYELNRSELLRLKAILKRAFPSGEIPPEAIDSLKRDLAIDAPNPDKDGRVWLGDLKLDEEATSRVWKTLVGREFISSELKQPDAAWEELGVALTAYVGSPDFYRCRLEDPGTRTRPWAARLPEPEAERVPIGISRERSRKPPARRPRGKKPLGQILLDCDPGIDDALAIVLAAMFFKKMCLSITAGNVGRDQCVRNAAVAAALVESAYGRRFGSIPLRCGSSRSLRGDRPSAGSVHGRDGFGEVPILDLAARPGAPTYRWLPVQTRPSGSAEEILRMGRTPRASRAFVFTGPLTNLALALLQAQQPDRLIRNLGAVVVMGGAFRASGNITPAAEFNTFFDPEALLVVLRFYQEYQQQDGGSDAGLFFVSLDTTERVQLFADWIDADWLKDLRGPHPESNEDHKAERRLALWTYDILQKYFAFHSRAARVSSICLGKERETAGRACEPHTPLARVTFMTDEYYKKRQEELRWRQRLNLSASKVLPRFCHLHDPLAVWVTARMQRDATVAPRLFKTVRVVASGVTDALRGLVVTEDDEAAHSPALVSKPWCPGTRVHFLDPEKFTLGDYADFLADLFRACMWKPSATLAGATGAMPWSEKLQELRGEPRSEG